MKSDGQPKDANSALNGNSVSLSSDSMLKSAKPDKKLNYQPFKYSLIILFALFFIILFIRIYLAFQTPYFSGEDAYFTIRQAEYISQNFLPFYEDPLSFGGHTVIFSPFFYYLISFFNLFIPAVFIGKILLNIFASSLIIIIYYITKDITCDEKASLFSAFVGGFIPIFFSATANTFSVYSFVFPLFFLMIYFYFRIEKAYSAFVFIALFFIISLSSSIGLLFIFSWIFYIILVKLENMEVLSEEIEIGMFSALLFIWLHLIIYKDAFFSHGLSIVWQNIPKDILNIYFQQITLVSAIYFVGVTSLLYGVYAVFYHTFYCKNKKTYFLVSLTIAAFFLLWLKLISIQLGLIIIGVVMSILFSRFYIHTFRYIKKTKFSRFFTVFWLFFAVLLILSSVVPSVYFTGKSLSEAPLQKEVDAFLWIKENTDEKSVILAPPQEGNLIAFFSGRKNVLDTNYLLVSHINTIFKDISEFYRTTYETKAIEILNNYNVDYIFTSKRIEKRINSNLNFLTDAKCFEKVFDNSETRIFKTLCRLK